MKHAAIVLALAATAALASCEALREFHANNPDYGSSSPPYESIQFASAVATPEERAKCEAAGGEVMMAGLLGHESCVQPYPDAGRACSDASDCLGQCMLDPSADVSMGDPATGTCQRTDSPFGCYATVRNGIAQPALCVD
ncbi:MAG: hypothetical protein R3B98_07125 [Hyphomonas sp.]